MKTEAEKEISLLSGLREREEGGGGRGLRRRRDKERGGEWRERREVILGRLGQIFAPEPLFKKYQSITFSAA